MIRSSTAYDVFIPRHALHVVNIIPPHFYLLTRIACSTSVRSQSSTSSGVTHMTRSTADNGLVHFANKAPAFAPDFDHVTDAGRVHIANKSPAFETDFADTRDAGNVPIANKSPAFATDVADTGTVHIANKSPAFKTAVA